MGPLTRSGIITFLVLVCIMMVCVQMFLGDVPAWVLCSNCGLAGLTSYVLWDCVGRYGLGRSVHRGTVLVPWIVLTAMANLCSICFSVRFYAVENYIAIVCFVTFIRQSMLVWQDMDAVRTLVWQGVMIGLVSSVFPALLLWIVIIPPQLFFMRCTGFRNILGVVSGVILGIWTAYCLFYFFGSGMSPMEMLDRYQSLLVIDWDLNLHTRWQWATVWLVTGMTVLYCLISLLMNVSNTLRAQSINFMLCVCQILVLLFTFVDVAHLPLYVLLQTMLLGLQLTVILANSRGHLAEWWTILILLCYVGLSLCPYLPQEFFERYFG